MVANGMLTPIDQSDWATPVHFVPKSDRRIRIVGDYKVTINKDVKDSEYLLPTITETLASLNGGIIFSQVDFKNVYKQIRMDSETTKKLIISTPNGLYTVNVMLDGLSPAPRIFQKFMVSRL